MPRKPWKDVAEAVAPPDDGKALRHLERRALRRLRRWNIRHHFALTWAFWLAVAAFFLWLR